VLLARHTELLFVTSFVLKLSYVMSEWYDHLTACEMCKRDGVAHSEKVKLSLCFMSQAFVLYSSFLGPVMPFMSVFMSWPWFIASVYQLRLWRSLQCSVPN